MAVKVHLLKHSIDSLELLLHKLKRQLFLLEFLLNQQHLSNGYGVCLVEGRCRDDLLLMQMLQDNAEVVEVLL
jgi:hypothetical protein